MKRAAWFFLAILFVLTSTGEIYACLCGNVKGKAKIDLMKSNAGTIFIGTVLENITQTNSQNESLPIIRKLGAKLQAEQFWKGAVEDTVDIYSSGDCGVPFEIGKTYLVYALLNKENQLETNTCLGTGLIEFSKDDFNYLGKPLTTYLQKTNQTSLAPGAPGQDAQWATAGKQGVGTSVNLKSKVWFTLSQGVLTEIYYPDVTVANVHLLQFVVVNPKTKKIETERDDSIHQVKVLRPDSLSFQQINIAKSGEWKITKTYTTDVERDSILIDVKFEPKSKELNLYVYFDPSLSNSGMKDEGRTLFNSQLSALDTTKSDNGASVLRFSGPVEELTNNFLGSNDGLHQLRTDGKITKKYERATDGNIVQMAKIKNPSQFTAVLSFAKNNKTAASIASASSQKGFAKAQAEYDQEWSDYVKTLKKVDPKYQAQFNMAAMILKAHEDKTNRGANIASLTVPWGGGGNANENNVGGYHLVWSRDLYQVATAFMALGDRGAALRALDFMFKVQQKPDGSFPQNSWLDGKPFWGSLQLDEVSFPLILAHELGRNDKETYEKHVKPAAEFIVKNGPVTPQERWEERTGYSPSTIAAEIAGLVCAAEIARKNGDVEAANRWLKTADEWQANIEKWTVTTNGKYGDGNYYLRITQKGNPNAGDKIDLGNGAGLFDEREIVDAGFLELVRLGIKSPDDPIIVKSLKVIDDVIRIKTPNGDGFYRYNHDGYGEMDDGRRWNWDGKYTGKGRLWALLSGERGQYELALKSRVESQESRVGNPKSQIPNPKLRLDTMLNFANDGLMIPEQIWDKSETPKNIDKQFVPELKFGEGTGSATPLAWSMAQFIRLAVNLQEGRNLDTPKVVYERYVLGKKSEISIKNTKDNEQSYLLNAVREDCFSDWRDHQSIAQQNDLAKTLTKSPIFWSCKNGDELAILVYHGNEKQVKIAGDFNGWKTDNDDFEFDSFSDDNTVKVLSKQFKRTARVEYKLIVDGKWVNDPLNPQKIDNGVGGENSVFTMPDYKPTTWDQDTPTPINGANPSGLINPKPQTIEIDSKIYGKRTIQVYVPSGYEASKSFPVLYLQDGSDYITRAKATNIAFNLVHAGKIMPFMMVFIDYKDRTKEYWASDDYAEFLAEEVVPMIDSKFKTIKSRDGRAVMGASLGGITSVHVGLKYPNIFGRIGGQSSSFWIDNERVVKDLEKLDGQTKFKFYFDDGTLEGVEDSHKVVEILKGKGFDVNYIEAEAGHNWTAWRDRLADAFISIWR
jgi:glucoamylase